MQPAPDDAHVHHINVTWGDCDPAQIAYTARLPAFALDAINAWWEAHFDGMGWFEMNVDQNLGTPFVRLEMDFHHPVTPRHRLICQVWPEKLGETSITFRVDASQDGTLCFSSRSVNVFVIADAFQKCAPPLEIRRRIADRIPASTIAD